MPASPSGRLLVDLSRASALVEFYPLVHPTPTQAILEVANALLQGSDLFTLRVGPNGVLATGAGTAPRSQHVERFGHRLAGHGAAQVAFRHDVGPDSLGRFLSTITLGAAVVRAGGGLVRALGAAGASRVAVDGEWVQGPADSGVGTAAPAADEEPGIELWSAHDMYQQVRDSALRSESEDTDELRALLREGADGERLQVLNRLEFLAQYYLAHGMMDRGIDMIQDLRRDAEALRRKDPATRSMVMLAIHRIANRMVIEELVRRLGRARTEEERAGLRSTLLHVGADAVTPLVREMVAASDVGARRAYRDAMVALDHAGVSLLEDMIGDERWFVVRNMVGILGDIRSPDAIDHFRRTVEHSDARVRRETVLALAKIGGEEAVPLLARGLNDAEAPLRAAAALGLGLTKLPMAAGPLLARLPQEQDEDVEVEIVRSLGRIGDPRAVEALAERARGGSFFSRVPPALRVEAVRALGEVGGEAATGVLRRLVRDRNVRIREAAQKALG
jgi:HEAT repeat protein